MIDPLTEDLISMTEATSMFPRNTRGRKIDVKSVYRYVKSGCRGVILESLKTPQLVTSRQAIARFMQRLSERDKASLPTPGAISARKQTSQTHQAVERELDRLGI